MINKEEVMSNVLFSSIAVYIYVILATSVITGDCIVRLMHHKEK